jgi:hypothetical protein
MFEKIKLQLAHIVLNKKYAKKNHSHVEYNKVISDATDILMIMPSNDQDFYHSLDLIKYFQIHKKNVTLFLPEHKYNLIPEKEKYKYISFHEEQLTRLKLPGKSLINRLRFKDFDVVVDLNKDENVLFSAITNIVNSNLRVGFNKTRSESYYNLQATNSEMNPELIYRNFLKFLQMF